MSEVLPTFSRKPLFGYAAIVFAGFGIAFIGFGVWAHHMFASAISPVAQAGFGLSTMVIAVPTGVKIFNWLGTNMGRKVEAQYPNAIFAWIYWNVCYWRVKWCYPLYSSS